MGNFKNNNWLFSSCEISILTFTTKNVLISSELNSIKVCPKNCKANRQNLKVFLVLPQKKYPESVLCFQTP